jgi:alkylation response protein AidB-like acyl-CoA dehydrogenase
MNFDHTDEQRMFQQTVRELAQSEVAPRTEEMDRTHQFQYDDVERMADLD